MSLSKQEILDKFGLEWNNFRSVMGSRRASRVRLDDLTLEPAEDGYVVRCILPKGAFATSLIRELTRVEELPNQRDGGSPQHDGIDDE